MGLFPASSISGQLDVPTTLNRLHLPNHMEHHVNVNDEIEALETWGYDSAGVTNFTLGNAGQGSTVVSKTTNWAHYRRFGRLALVDLSLTFTGTGSFGNPLFVYIPAPLYFTLYASNVIVGDAYAEDAGVSGWWAYGLAAGADVLYFATTTTYAYVGGGWTVGNGDYLAARFWAWIQG